MAGGTATGFWVGVAIVSVTVRLESWPARAANKLCTDIDDVDVAGAAVATGGEGWSLAKSLSTSEGAVVAEGARR